MVAKLISGLSHPISRVRLDAYRPPSGTDEEMLANYLWNVALAEALYPLLAAVEIGLRNGIHEAMTQHFNGDEFWFNNSTLFPSRGKDPHPQQRAVIRARSSLRGRSKQITAGRIIAELHFGFWTTMLNRNFHQIWFENQAAALKVAFPLATGANRQRKIIHKRFDDIRLLRNRVFHHEPIWNRPTLPDEYDQMCEAVR